MALLDNDVIAGQQLNTFTILDSNGSPLSYQNISAEYNRLEMAAGHVASDFYCPMLLHTRHTSQKKDDIGSGWS